MKQLRYDPNAVLSSANNPPLQNGDVVVVDRNNLSKITDGMNDAQPLTPIVNAVSVPAVGLANGREQLIRRNQIHQIPSRSQITSRFSWCNAVLKQSASSAAESRLVTSPSASRLARKSPPAVFQAVWALRWTTR